MMLKTHTQGVADDPPANLSELYAKPGAASGRLRLDAAPGASARVVVWAFTTRGEGPGVWLAREAVTVAIGGTVDVGHAYRAPVFPPGEVIASAAPVPAFEPDDRMMTAKYGSRWRLMLDAVTVFNRRVDPVAWLRSRLTQPIAFDDIGPFWLAVATDQPSGTYSFAEVGS